LHHAVWRTRFPMKRGTRDHAMIGRQGTREDLCPGFAAEQRKLQIPLQVAFFGTIVLSVALSWLGLFLPTEVLARRMHSEVLDSFSNISAPQEELIDELVTSQAINAYRSVLISISEAIQLHVVMPPQEALNSMWLMMLASRHVNASWTGTSKHDLWGIAYREWILMVDMINSTESATIHFTDGVHLLESNRYVQSVLVAFETGEVVGVTALGHDRALDASSFDTYAFIVRSSNPTSLSAWPVNSSTGQLAELPVATSPYNLTRQPYYSVQAEHAMRALDDAAAETLWSKVYGISTPNSSRQDLGISLTRPITFCGTYKCFEGSVAAILTLRYINELTSKALQSMHQSLVGANASNSNIFIVGRSSDQPADEGYLIGAANADTLVGEDGRPRLATSESNPEIVHITAAALINHFSRWDDRELLAATANFTFRWGKALQNPPVYESCDVLNMYQKIEDCMQVGTTSISLDSRTKWIIVTVVPANTFGAAARMAAREVHELVKQQERAWSSALQNWEAACVGLVAGVVIATTGLALALGYLVVRPLWQLGNLNILMRRLGDLDFAHESKELGEMRTGSLSFIKEVGTLQTTFCRLSQSIETFARFVPEGVVRRIVRGDHRAAKPHVSMRTVTIMFTDIQDFTTISESLSQTDLLFLLTRYLTVMTRIAEAHNGEVTEILGDGLLAFWNTPDDVPDHAWKACATALAMQEALTELNEDFLARSLPHVSIRVGVHTGQVLSGNIGCNKKMKFGCLGDPVNLASRLEGLCKVFGVNVLCSEATHAALQPDGDPKQLLSRKLALVQVKGKREPIWVYEIMGRRDQSTAGEICGGSAELTSDLDRDVEAGYSRGSPTLFAQTESSADISAMAERARLAQGYEAALSAFHEMRFKDAEALIQEVLGSWPQDAATIKLQERILHFTQSSDGGEFGSSPQELAAWTGTFVITEK